MGISCYRFYDHDLPEFPFCIEKYGENIYMAEYKRHHKMDEGLYATWQKSSLSVVSETTGVAESRIYFKIRQRKQGKSGQYRKIDSGGEEMEVEEGGLKFLVNLADYLDTGLFLDHRITRGMVRDESKNKAILNLFAYTGSFSVYAAAGGAHTVVTVDLSKTYLQWAERNMKLNGFSESKKYRYIQEDAIKFLKSETSDYDLIILDPPTFSNSKRMDGILDIQRDHIKLINDCLKILNPGGLIYFSTNFKNFTLDGTSIQSDDITDITRKTTPFDFEGKLHRACFRICRK